MISLLALPATMLALAAPHSQTAPTVTAHQALRATESRIIPKVRRKTRGNYSALNTCTAASQDRHGLGPNDKAYRWRCSVKVKGKHLPGPCVAEAYVSATRQAHALQVQWVLVSRSCRLEKSKH